MKDAMTPNPQFEEGMTEVINPQTGMDISDVSPGSIELMPVVDNIATDTTHEGDMGRMNQ